MHRRLLASLMVLGLVTTALGGAGLFAAFSDTASTGTNSLTSGERARVADLKIFVGNILASNCNDAGLAYEDSTTTPFFTITDFGGNRLTNACLRNVGTGTLSLQASILDLTDTEVGCTGDEAAVDATCGTGVGELSSVVDMRIDIIPQCSDAYSPDSNPGSILKTTTAVSMGSIGPGATLCFLVRLSYSASASEAALQAAQSDKTTWSFDFVGTN